MKRLLQLFVLLAFSSIWAQNYPMTAANHGQTFVTCSGTFTDDGGPTGNYSNNINNRTITFCTANAGELLRFNFTQFITEGNYDVLEVFHGPLATGQPAATYSGTVAPFIFMSNQPGGCVTFRFTSDSSVNPAGWSAGISCVVPCTAPTAALVDSSTLDVCSSEAVNPGDLTVQFDASNSFSNDSYTISKYEWNWGDGTTSTTTTPVTTHTFPDDPGIYTVSLKVRTNNTGTDPLGCLSSNTAVRLIKVLPPPNFGGSTYGPLEIDCGESVTLTGIGGSQIITQEPPPNVGSEISLPDGDGVSYYSYLDLTGYFPPGATLTNTCFPEIMLELEHSFAGDLWIDLIAPSGQQVRLFNGYGPFGSQKFGWCVNGADNLQPGCVAPYHIVNSGGLTWGEAAGYTNFTQSCTVYPGPCESGQYFLQDGTFNSSQSMNSLIGAELNGIWILKISDEWSLDDGFISSWSLSFPGDCYTDLATETPILSGGLWTSDGNGPDVPETQNVQDIVITPIGLDPCPGDTNCDGNMLINTIQVGPFNQAGTYTYTFTIIDEFGCTFEKTVDVIVDGIETILDDIEDEYCLNAEPQVLPTISANGVHGTWSPAVIDTSIIGGPIEYVFTPDEDECGTIESIFVTITDLEEASFTAIQLDYCQFEEPALLTTTSLEGYTGTWSPAVISTDTFGTFTYTFTPDDQCVDSLELIVNVEEKIHPTFADLGLICQNTEAPILPNANEAGITGTWNPAVIDTSLPPGDYVYVFTPDAGICAFEEEYTITITNELPVQIDIQDIYCQGETPIALPTTLENGVTGVWVPAVIDTNTVGVSTYTFMPDEGQCALDTPVQITVNPELVLIPLPVQEICDEDFDGILEINLTTLNAGMSNEAGITYQYYGSATDLANNNPIPQGQWNNYPITGTLPITIYVVGINPQGCPSDPLPVQIDARDIAVHNPGTYGPIEYCVNDTVDLTQYEGNISAGNVTFTYYESLQNAQNEAGMIQNLTEYNPTSNTIYVRIDQIDRCPAFVEITLAELPTPSLELSDDSVILCYEDSTEVTAMSDDPTATFQWTFPDGTIMVGATQTVSETGNYSVVAFSVDNCESATRNFTVSLPSQPFITGVDATGNSITVTATNNGEGPMEYSLDGTFWQSSPLFSNLIPGEEYTIWVRSSGCMIEKYTVTLLFVPNFISPNNDGINDTWTIRGIETSPNSTIKIFDRYGKIFVDTNFEGNYVWDGRYLGNNVPSGDYWYIINVPGTGVVKQKKYTGHISVRNQ
jgi:gliding motility-associated-like protein